MTKKSKESWKIYGNVFDEFTLKCLSHIEGQGHFDELKTAYKVGKESNVFIAYKDGRPVIVKIYRLENCNFNKMYLYLRDDPRYPSIKPRRREIIFAWVLREYRNLLVAREKGCSVPTPIINRGNVLVEEYIGDSMPAKMLKDAVFENDAEIEDCAKKVIAEMTKLYQDAEIVHADLSEYNILYYNKKPIFIDFSQSTATKDYHSSEYLKRDIKNIVRFFNKIGLSLDETKIYSEITTLKKNPENTLENKENENKKVSTKTGINRYEEKKKKRDDKAKKEKSGKNIIKH